MRATGFQIKQQNGTSHIFEVYSFGEIRLKPQEIRKVGFIPIVNRPNTFCLTPCVVSCLKSRTGAKRDSSLPDRGLSLSFFLFNVLETNKEEKEKEKLRKFLCI
mmetsp:Transcript_23095/g.35971  ORF Transcript_23095/g.35971 Transcript_23095/m.35971 type:complete len:104 (+) Transcript_23095:1942-2253(+)